MASQIISFVAFLKSEKELFLKFLDDPVKVISDCRLNHNIETQESALKLYSTFQNIIEKTLTEFDPVGDERFRKIMNLRNKRNLSNLKNNTKDYGLGNNSTDDIKAIYTISCPSDSPCIYEDSCTNWSHICNITDDNTCVDAPGCTLSECGYKNNECQDISPNLCVPNAEDPCQDSQFCRDVTCQNITPRTCEDFTKCVDSSCENDKCMDRDSCLDVHTCQNKTDCQDGGHSGGCFDTQCQNGVQNGEVTTCGDLVNCKDIPGCTNIGTKCVDSAGCKDSFCHNTGDTCADNTCSDNGCRDTAGSCTNNSCSDKECYDGYCSNSEKCTDNKCTDNECSDSKECSNATDCTDNNCTK